MKADKTKALIDEMIARDNGNLYRSMLKKRIEGLTDAFRSDETGPRAHLGASLIGKACDRALWYGFRWMATESFSGRMLRLFNRGHLEEARFMAMLDVIGCESWVVDPKTGKQLGFKGYKGLFAGSFDCVTKGLPEMPHNYVLCEFKTHSNDSFKKLEENGVLNAKWEHFVQMQIYMGQANLSWALYMAVNKNDDSIYPEYVPFDRDVYERYTDRAIKIIDTTEPPEKVSKSPGWFLCKTCTYSDVCHRNGKRLVTCRSCKNGKVAEGGFTCAYDKSNTLLTKEQQLSACKFYEPL